MVVVDCAHQIEWNRVSIESLVPSLSVCNGSEEGKAKMEFGDERSKKAMDGCASIRDPD